MCGLHLLGKLRLLLKEIHKCGTDEHSCLDLNPLLAEYLGLTTCNLIHQAKPSALKVSHNFFLMIDIGSSSEFLCISKMAPLLTYIKGCRFMCRINNVARRTVSIFLDMSFPHKPVEHESIKFHALHFIHL